jgi:hypothetical protein
MMGIVICICATSEHEHLMGEKIRAVSDGRPVAVRRAAPAHIMRISLLVPRLPVAHAALPAL